MALQKSLVHLNLSGGIQRKDDERLTIPSKLTVADNVEFDDASTVVRRGGQVKHALTATQSPSVSMPQRAFSHQGNLVLESEMGVHRVNPVFGTTPVKPPSYLGVTTPEVFTRAGMTTARIGSVERKGTAYGSGIPITDSSIDCAAIDDTTCYAWETRDTTGYGRQAVKVVIVDDATGSHIYSTLLTGGASNIICKPRVIASTTKFYIYYAEYVSGGNSWDLKVITITTGLTVTAAATACAGATTGGTTGSANNMPLFDVMPLSAAFQELGAVVLANNSTFTVRFISLNTTDGATNLVVASSVASALPTSLTALTKSGRVHAFFGINTNVVRAMNMVLATGVVSAEATVGTGAVGTTVGRIEATGTLFPTAPGIGIIFDTISVVGSGLSSCLRLSGFSNTYGTTVECAGPAPWVIAGKIATNRFRKVIPLAFVSDLYQSTIFVADVTSMLANANNLSAVGPPPHVLARIDYGECALNYQRWARDLRLPNTLFKRSSDEGEEPLDDILIVPYLKYETDVRIVGDDDETAVAAAAATIRTHSQLGDEEINGVTFLAGACPMIYDGELCVEEGFHHGPEILAAITPAASGTYQFANATAVYTVSFTQAWQDAQGNWYESMPSNEKQVSITGGSGNYYITPAMVQAPTLKPGARLLMYRTQGSSTDTSLYIATRVDGSTVTYDAELISGEQLYTTGGVLPNTPAPACRQVSLFQKRLVLAGCGDGSKIHWSKASLPGYCVEFTDGDPSHQTSIPQSLGRAVGTQEMDDNLVVLCERGLGVIGGTGPAPTGTQGQYSDFSTRSVEVGCHWDSPKSIIRGPEGVWFRSPFGIRLFSRSGVLAVGQDGKQVGSEVDNLVSGTLVAVAGATAQQLRFYQSSGTVLVWDYQWRQWTRFTGMSNVDAVFANNRFYHFSLHNEFSPLLRYTDNAAYRDVSDLEVADTEFSGLIETAWLSFAGIQGFQRIYRLGILGKNVDGSVQTQSITGTTKVDFLETVADTFTSTVTPSAGGVIQLQNHLKKQKCESLKLSISFKPTTSNTGRLRLTDLTLQVGVKPGYFKLASSKRI